MTTLFISLIYPQGIIYNACPEGYEGLIILKYIISGPFNYAEKDGHLKILTGCFWGNDGRGRGLITLQSLPNIKKGTSPSNSQSNKPFPRFLQQLLLYEAPQSWSLISRNPISFIVKLLGDRFYLPTKEALV